MDTVNSPLTWLIDLDGTIVFHNGHLSGADSLLNGVVDFWGRLPAADHVVIVTARDEKFRKETTEFLLKHSIRFDHLIMGLPPGRRILINDMKPDGSCTAIAVNVKRNAGLGDIEVGDLTRG